jgi:hypothetical protein
MPALSFAPCPLFRRALAIGACLAMTAFPPGACADEAETAPAPGTASAPAPESESESESESEPKPAKRIQQLRDEAEALRDQAEATYRKTETACYKRFFVNSCIDDAKSERLATIRRAREIENEAYQMDLAERRRVAAETEKKAEGRGDGVRPTDASSPGGDVDITRRSDTANPARRVIRSNPGTNPASARARAARRAEAARRDRERYDARIRELEEKKARDADGR